MPRLDVVVESAVSRSPRARQLEGMFDVPSNERQRLEWSGDVPIETRDWNVGLIVGPSGCGKSTVARQMFGEFDAPLEWNGKSVIDDFDPALSIKDIAAICQAVGFNTIPAWLRPHAVLSNGEKFRVEMARRIVETKDIIVIDEFTSVVDRQVAQIGSHAVQKAVRRNGKKFVAVSCHYDIVDWLNPDWILEPATMNFEWRCLQRRPELEVEIYKVDYAAWSVFAPFHYLTADLHRAAQCFCLFVGGRPAVFGGMLHRPHSKVNDIWGLSRLVTLPDFQGLGLAFVFTDALGAAFKAMGQRMHTYPAHPALIKSFDASPKWRLEKKPGMTSRAGGGKGVPVGAFGGRPNAVFCWAGEAMDRALARDFLSIRSLSA